MPTYTPHQIRTFIEMISERTPRQPKVKKTVWDVVYLGKTVFTGNYPQCVKYRNQFKGQRDFNSYSIK